MFILFYLTIALAKFTRLTIPVNDVRNNIYFLQKYGIDLGKGTFSFRIRLTQPFDQQTDDFVYFRFHIFTDDYWPMQKREPKCTNKRTLGTYLEKEKLPLNGEWSNLKERRINLHYRDKIYIIATSDCDGELAKIEGYQIEIEITSLNNGSHFSCEDNGIQKLYGIQIIASLLIGIYCLKQGKDDLFIKYVMRVLFIDIIAEVSFLLHYTVYSYNGIGIYLFDLLGSISNNASQLLFAFLFVALSQGWTITKQELNTVQFFPFISMVVIYQSIIMIIIKYFDGSEDKYHNFYGIGGWLLMFSKVGLTFLYTYGITRLYQQVKQKQFIVLIAIIGILYQIHYPVVVFITEMFVVPYWKNRVITMTTILVSHLCMVFCAFICTTKSTAYFQLKNQSQTII
ncbi:unnamed protein product [Paramecium sonneborni]|uniref:GPR180/TMEM145 transmembrane domain-containing protein n=1 Tax=Paramecium sonneborni TaxID=65129 RepID=A0A8S1M455_9CILI|nr:unnamed protein product [Paramecium sonneborni]